MSLRHQIAGSVAFPQHRYRRRQLAVPHSQNANFSRQAQKFESTPIGLTREISPFARGESAMENLWAILALGGLGAAAGLIAAFLSSEVVRTEGLGGVVRWAHWKISTTERTRHPYGH